MLKSRGVPSCFIDKETVYVTLNNAIHAFADSSSRCCAVVQYDRSRRKFLLYLACFAPSFELATQDHVRSSNYRRRLEIKERREVRLKR